MLKNVFFIITICFCALNTIQAQKEKPNVILIITDDQGYGDIAAHGNKVIKTPNLDQLAQEGVRLTNFHSGSTCAPSRSGLMSGMEGHRAGVWHTIAGCNILREKFIAMPQVFKDNGYATAMYGKWHLGDAYPYLPENRGFEETVYHGAGGIGQTPDYWDNDYFDDTYMKNGKAKKYKGYCTDVFFREAIDFIERKKDQPFFLYLSTNAPHGPLNVPEKYYNIYKNETRITEQQKAYYGMITNIDDNLALLEKKLKKLGLRENTILIFTTDNGTQYGHKRIKGKEYGYNAGMRGLKGSPYEGGHRVPFFVRWEKGKLKTNFEVDKLTMNYDILPTLIDLCSLKKPTATNFDGRSLGPLLHGKNKAWPKRYAVVDKNKSQQPMKWKLSSVMDEHWRLINGKELYNLHKDVGQRKNIAKQHPEKVKEMRAAYVRWWEYVSRDFSRYEAYKIGGSQAHETVITIHDLHTSQVMPWSQELVRNPENGKKDAYPQGFWMIDVQEEGYYEIALRRWPKESGYKFNSDVPQLGKTESWYQSRPEGRKLNIKKATIDIAALHQEQKVDMKKDAVKFKVYLSKGRAQLNTNFVTEDGKTFSAFYAYIQQVKGR